MSAPRPPNDGVRNLLRRRVGQRFHADAYAHWAAGEVFVAIARRCGVSERQVRRWALAEGWKARLEATQHRAARLVVNKDAERLAKIALRHRKTARALQRYAQGLLSCGAVVLDPRTSRPYVLTKDDGTASGFVFRPLLPAELNQAAQAFVKAAELEYGRAGGKQAGQQDDRMPNLVARLERIEAERRMTIVDSGSTAAPLPDDDGPPADADPRLMDE